MAEWSGGVSLAANVDTLVWSGVPSRVVMGVPFAATVRGVDASGQPTTSFNGTVRLVGSARAVGPHLLISEVAALSAPAVEISHVGDAPVYLGGWRLTFYDSVSWPAPRAILVLATDAYCAPGEVFRVASGGTSPGVYPSFALGTNLAWSSNLPNNPIAVLLQDSTGNPVDFFSACGGHAFLIQSPIAIPSEFWRGLSAPANGNASRSYQRIGSMDHDNAADWIIENRSMGAFNTGLSFPFSGGVRSVSVLPSIVQFSEGEWHGTITVHEPIQSMWLHVDDGVGVVGDSAVFTVAAGPALGLSLPTGGSEAAPGPLGAGQAFVTQVFSTNVTIELSLDVAGEIAVPASVVLAAGATNVMFSVTNLDDTLLDGTRIIHLTAHAPGFESVTGVVTNADDEVGQLQVILPATGREGDGMQVGRVRLNRPAGRELPVALSSNKTNEVAVPSAVLIPAGKTEATFAVAIIDDAYLDGPQAVVVRAVAAVASGEAPILVNDNESATLFLDLFYPVEEGRGIVSNAVRVTLGGLAASNVVVNLASFNPARLQVPATMTVSAGQVSAFSYFVVPDDVLTNGQAVVPVAASAPGFPSSTNTTQVIDNDLHHFTFVNLPVVQVSGQPFDVTVYAHTIDGYVPSAYTGQVTLRAEEIQGAVSIDPPTITFQNGSWQGKVAVTGETYEVTLVAEGALGHSGASNPILIINHEGYGASIADVVYDPLRDQIVAGIQSGAVSNANMLVGINPRSGAVIWRKDFGTDPGRMALSSDQSTLYVGQNATGGVARVNRSVNSISARFPLHPNPLAVEDMEVLPGSPQTVVISRRELGNNFNQGVAVYDNGIVRRDIAGVNFFCCGYSVGGLEPSGTFHSAYSSALRRLSLATNGVVIEREVRGFPYGGDVTLANGLLYSTLGHVFHPTTLELLGSFPVAGSVVPDVSRGRVYFLVEGSGSASLQAYDLSNRVRMATVNLPTFGGGTRRFIRTGEYGFAALSAAGHLYRIKDPLPGTNGASGLAVRVEPITASPTAGFDFAVSLSVSNTGSVELEGVRLSDALGLPATLVSAQSPQGSCDFQGGELVCEGMMLPPNGSVAVQVNLRVTNACLLPHSVTATGRAAGDVWTVAAGTYFSSVKPAQAGAPIVLLQMSARGDGYDGAMGLRYPPPDLVYDPATQRIVVGHQRLSPRFEGGLAVLDPTTGIFERVSPLPQSPGRLAISPEGRQLYAAMETQWKVQPYDVMTSQFGTPFALPQSSRIQDMDVQPGHPETVAVSVFYHDHPALPSYGGSVALYDAGFPRSNTVYSPFIEFSGDGSFLFGSEGEGFYRNRVTATGLTRDALLYLGSAIPFLTDMRIGGELAYYGFGAVLDPFLFVTTNRYRVLAGESIACPDAVRHKVYFLENFATNWIVEAYSTDTAALVATVTVPETGGQSPLNLVRWGDDGLAFSTRQGRIFLVRISQMTPVPQLVVAQAVSPTQASVGSNVTYSIMVSNAGLARAEDVMLTDLLPRGSVLFAAAASQGTVESSDGAVVFRLGSMADHATVTANVTVVPGIVGLNTNSCEIGARLYDLSSGVHRSVLEHWVQFGGPPRPMDEMNLVTTDLAYDASRGRLLASVPAAGRPYSNAVVAIDLATGVLTPVYSAEEPGKLGVSGGGEFTYVGLARTSAVVRLTGAGGQPDARIELGDGNPFGPYLAFDLAPLPGVPASVAISYRTEFAGYNRSISIFDDAIPRTSALRTTSGAGYFYLGFAGTPSSLYVSSPAGFQTFEVDSTGLAPAGPETAGYDGDFVVGNERIYLASGLVLHPVTRVLLANLQTPPGYIAADFQRQWVYLFNQDASLPYYPWKLRVYDALNYSQQWVLTLPGIGRVDGVIGLGTNGVACRTDVGRVMIVRAAEMDSRRADLSVEATDSPDPAVVGAGLTYSVTLRNDGPWTASGITLTNVLPAGITFVSAIGSQGQCSDVAGEVRCAVGSLNVGATFTLTLAVIPTLAGIVTNRVSISHDAPDPVSTNNSVEIVSKVNPSPALSIRDGAVLEGGDRTAIGFNLALTGPSTVLVSVSYATSNGTAIAGTDYDAASGIVVFTPGVTNRMVTLTPGIRGNAAVGSNRFFYVTISNSTNASIARAQARGWIVEDDFSSISVQNVSIAEGDSARTDATFIFSLFPASLDTVSVNYALLDRTAVAGSDYLARPGTLVFPPGTTNRTLLIPILGDQCAESDETFQLQLSAPSRGLLTANEVTGRILNDDPVSPLRVLDLTRVGEGWRVDFSSACDQSYRLLRSDRLDGDSWIIVADQILGTGAAISVLDTTPVSSHQAFYRIEVAP